MTHGHGNSLPVIGRDAVRVRHVFLIDRDDGTLQTDQPLVLPISRPPVQHDRRGGEIRLDQLHVTGLIKPRNVSGAVNLPHQRGRQHGGEPRWRLDVLIARNYNRNVIPPRGLLR
ncbi:hypothetical protein SDC9_134703 [bioreactor metagenome]|uniref:Uncharacterized protein n=1 Tax=bioreactor metagenome TaxID=1076179 RepID=A0A645DFJ5_9ZZZZ